MNFNEKQSKEIYEFIMKYNSDEGFKSNIQNLYNKEISKLSILHIYALEEILRYGTKGIFLSVKNCHSFLVLSQFLPNRFSSLTIK